MRSWLLVIDVQAPFRHRPHFSGADLADLEAAATFDRSRHSALVGTGLKVWLNQNGLQRIMVSGIALFLHRIAAVCGPSLAAQVAQTMVVAMRRGPGDPELSPFLRHRNHMHPAVHRVQDAVSQAPQQDWNAPRLAEVASTSPRYLTRLFIQHAGIAPMRCLRGIRLDLAEAALNAGRSVGEAAEMAGFSSDAPLRRTWHQLGKGGSPARPAA